MSLWLSCLVVVFARRRAATAGYHSFDIVFNSSFWDWYILIKHVSEWMILFMMLWILHDPGEEDDSVAGSDDSRGVSGAEGGEYWEVPAEPDGYGGGGRGSKVGGPASELAVDGRRVDKYGAI